MKTTIIALVLALASVAASASTISLLSGISPGQTNVINGHNVVITPPSVYATDPGGAEWISFENTGVGGIVLQNSAITPVALYIQYFLIPAGETGAGTLDVWADDTAAVYVNGLEVYHPDFTAAANCVTFAPSCTAGKDAVVALSGLVAGPNDIDIVDYQLFGEQSGVMYDAQIVTTPIGGTTPEPGTMAVVGLGLVGLAWKGSRSHDQRAS